MLLITCKCDEGFSLLNKHVKVVSIVDSTVVKLSVTDATTGKQDFLIGMRESGWLQLMREDCLVVMDRVQSNKVKFQIDAPREVSVHRLQRLKCETAANQITAQEK
jgi:sRNA-binding carbon storage regulator CsrA